MSCYLIRQVRCLDPGSGRDQIGDVLIAHGQIQAMAPVLSDVPADAEVMEGQGWVLGPGLIDLYSHSGEPGYETRETLASLLAAAQAGGFTRITVLPDTDPALDTPAAIADLRRLAAGQSGSKLQIWGALTLGDQGKHMAPLAELAATEIVGFAAGQPLQDWALVRRLLEYGQSLGKPLAVWPCDRTLSSQGVAREGLHAWQFGLPTVPVMAETAALATLIECIAEIPTPVHIMRVSTARSLEILQDAKDRHLPITASVSWLHVLLDVQALQSYDPALRLDPPLGTPTDRQALIRGVQTGLLDAIAIDHSPWTFEEKTVAFSEAPPGAIGLELALPLLWNQLVETGQLTPLDLWHRLCQGPACCLQQAAAMLQVGQPAELTLFSPQTPWTVTPDTLQSLATNTAWLGQAIRGQVVRTWSA